MNLNLSKNLPVLIRRKPFRKFMFCVCIIRNELLVPAIAKKYWNLLLFENSSIYCCRMFQGSRCLVYGLTQKLLCFMLSKSGSLGGVTTKFETSLYCKTKANSILDSNRPTWAFKPSFQD